MIHYRLLLIETQDTIRAIKLKKQKEFVKEYAMGFVAWLDKNKKELKKIILIEELLEIYEFDQDNKVIENENYLFFDSKINKY